MTIYFYTINCQYGSFSNFASYGIKLDGWWWPTVEHYFQAQKFTDEQYQEVIRTAFTPALAKKFGRNKNFPIRQDWDEVRDSVMLIAVREKFTIHKELQALLLSTGDDILVENSPSDYYWGCGKDGTGKNRLGTILMQVRSELLTATN